MIKASVILLLLIYLKFHSKIEAKDFIGDCGYGFCEQLCKKVDTDVMKCACRRGYTLKSDGRRCIANQDDTIYSGDDESGDGERKSNCDDEQGTCGKEEVISGDGDYSSSFVLPSATLTSVSTSPSQMAKSIAATSPNLMLPASSKRLYVSIIDRIPVAPSFFFNGTPSSMMEGNKHTPLISSRLDSTRSVNRTPTMIISGTDKTALYSDTTFSTSHLSFGTFLCSSNDILLSAVPVESSLFSIRVSVAGSSNGALSAVPVDQSLFHTAVSVAGSSNGASSAVPVDQSLFQTAVSVAGSSIGASSAVPADQSLFHTAVSVAGSSNGASLTVPVDQSLFQTAVSVTSSTNGASSAVLVDQSLFQTAVSVTSSTNGASSSERVKQSVFFTEHLLTSTRSLSSSAFQRIQKTVTPKQSVPLDALSEKMTSILSTVATSILSQEKVELSTKKNHASIISAHISKTSRHLSPDSKRANTSIKSAQNGEVSYSLMHTDILPPSMSTVTTYASTQYDEVTSSTVLRLHTERKIVGKSTTSVEKFFSPLLSSSFKVMPTRSSRTQITSVAADSKETDKLQLSLSLVGGKYSSESFERTPSLSSRTAEMLTSSIYTFKKLSYKDNVNTTYVNKPVAYDSVLGSNSKKLQTTLAIQNFTEVKTVGKVPSRSCAVEISCHLLGLVSLWIGINLINSLNIGII